MKGPRVTLGYDVTVYEDGVGNPECSTSGMLPEVFISEWAAAPELYNHHGGTQSRDVWQVGILALELAYGGVRVPSRETLENRD
ncbi:hypothetical protein DM860_014528 [Cuscuta australis]|uniref:Protein kinase domain-containing protein n=1 Tax=Cuscuta australis TaxID=267555 RepID=A0A328DZD6_9ASTE|nr:hypothetical protein DM860_014528 [Cuscuta australis]